MTQLQVASATHTGMVRRENEDALHVDANGGYAILADGMGGYNAGEVASRIAVATIIRRMQENGERGTSFDDDTASATIIEQVRAANEAIYRCAHAEARYSGMGTTLVMALWYGDRMTVGHVGDSRLYRLRGDALEQITRDHSVLQEQIDSGLITKEAARFAPYKNLVTRALGIDIDVQVETHCYSVQPDDVYLLCSDGLSDMVEQERMKNTICCLKDNLPLAAERLVQQANDAGGRDNISLILVHVAGSIEYRGAPPKHTVG